MSFIGAMDEAIEKCREFVREEREALQPLFGHAEKANDNGSAYALADSKAADFGERARELVATIAQLLTSSEEDVRAQAATREHSDKVFNEALARLASQEAQAVSDK
jgi:hypothetical protein